MRRKSAMTQESWAAVCGAAGAAVAAGGLGCAWATVKSKQPAAYQLQCGLFLTRMAVTFNSHGFLSYGLYRHLNRNLEPMGRDFETSSL